MHEALTTQRLVLRPLQLSDAERTQQLFPHWEIVRLLSAVVPWPFPADGAFVYYRDVALPAIERGDEWHWTIRLKIAPDEHVGAISLFRSEWDNRGFWMGLPWQGRGLMTEAVVAATDFWFDTLGFQLLRAPKAAENHASNRISEKTGMRILSPVDKDYVSGRLPGNIWEINAGEWHRGRDAVLAGLRKGPGEG